MNHDRIELRVTRCKFYHPNTPQLSREGHYIRGADEADAKQKARDRFPGEELTFTVWKRFNSKGGQIPTNERDVLI